MYFVINLYQGKIKLRTYGDNVFLGRKPRDPNLPQDELLSGSKSFFEV
jgi:hypothetical protein